MPAPSANVINVQPLIGTAWLAVHWKEVAFWSFLSLFPLYYIYRWWRNSSHTKQSLFDYTLAESYRKSGDLKNAIQLYDQILSRACHEDLRWRAVSGRSQVLYLRGDRAEAMAQATLALDLARQVSEKRQQQASTKSNAANAHSVEEELGPDTDPFLHAPISLASLHYQRGLIADALGETDLAEADFLVAIELDSDRSFVQGYAARRAFEDRLERAGSGSGSGSGSSSSSSKTTRSTSTSPGTSITKRSNAPTVKNTNTAEDTTTTTETNTKKSKAN